jgi:hypothetical protein
VARHRFALLLLPSVVTVLGCEIVSGLSDLEKDPTFDPDAETSAPVDTGAPSETSSTVDTGTAVTDTGSAPMDTSTVEDASVCGGRAGAKVFEGHCYFPLTTNLSFDDAKTKCSMEGGYLAIITSSGENDVVAQIDNAAERWIGLARASADPNTKESYKWVDGSSFDATKFDGWQTGEPNDGDSARLKGADAKWYDRAGATTTAAGIHAICEKDSTS